MSALFFLDNPAFVSELGCLGQKKDVAFRSHVKIRICL